LSEREAILYERGADGVAACRLCPHRCDIPPEGRGRCEVRLDLHGVLYATNFEELSRCDVLPVEAVPLARFRPGTRFLTVGGIGESFPAELAPPTRPVGVEGDTKWAATHETIDIAAGQKVAGLAFAGGEPFMWLEHWRDLAAAARAEGLATVAVTNAFALPAAVAEIAPHLDAVNVAFYGPAATYRLAAGIDRAPVLETLAALRAAGVHLELTYLVLAHDNDTPAAIDETTQLVRDHGIATIHVASPAHLDTAAPVKAVHAVSERFKDRLGQDAVILSPMYRYG
jgi:pyruvate formate lyase activating enzyme